MNILLLPVWFYGMDIALDFLFAIVTLALAWFAFKVYRQMRNMPARLFALAFGCIGASFLTQSLFNTAAVAVIYGNYTFIEKLSYVTFFDSWAMNLHMVLYLLGLAVLLFMTFRNTTYRVLSVVLLMTIIALLLSVQMSLVFHALSIIYLFFICWYFVDNYNAKKQFKALIIATAFCLLLVSHLFAMSGRVGWYVTGTLVELGAYLLLTWNYYLIRRGSHEKAR